MPVKIQRLMQELKNGLAELYGIRLKSVILFGSYARGDFDESSDLDIMIVLGDYRSYWEELVRTSHLVSDLSLKFGITISRIIMTEEQWRSADMPILRNVRAEGIAA
ncbi:MAG: nucleotidyltransferase domain-containing protein [Chloroflexota bacterium]